MSHYLGHLTGHQPIRDQYFLIRSVHVIYLYLLLLILSPHIGVGITATISTPVRTTPLSSLLVLLESLSFLLLAILLTFH